VSKDNPGCGRLPWAAAAATTRTGPLDTDRHTCHIITVTLFGFTLQPGQSIFDQVVFAATKAFVSGQFQPGQPFPSVRALAADMKIHPNTAHKVVQYLIQERWLDVQPGMGTVVAARPPARAGDRKRLLHHEVEQLVVEALRVGVQLEDVVEAIETRWARLAGSAQPKIREVSRK
jgi:GntR family transcriptional regulator